MHNITQLLALITLLFIATTQTAVAHGYKEKSEHHHHHHKEKSEHHAEKGFAIKHPQVKTTPPGIQNSAVYFTLHNHTEINKTLIGAKSAAAQIVEVHEHVVNNGVMKMQKTPAVSIPAGSVVKFKPGGYHIMLINVTHPIKAGDKIEIELSFADGEAQQITATAVESVKTKSGKHHHHHH